MSIRHLKRISILIAVVIVLCSRLSTYADEAVDLRPKFPQGRTRYVEVLEKTEQVIHSAQMPGGKMKMKIDSTKGLIERVESATPDGVKLVLTYDRAGGLWDVPMMGGTLQYDTDLPSTDENPYLRQILKPMIGMPLTVELDKDRKVRSLTGMVDIVKAIQKKAAANPLFMSMRAGLSDDTAKLTWGDGRYMVLPGKKVKAGDTWTGRVEQEYPQIGTMVVAIDCKLESIQAKNGKKTAVISYSGTIQELNSINEDAKAPDGDADDPKNVVEPEDAKSDTNKGTLRGTATFDLQRGEIVEQIEDSEMRFNVQSPMGAVDVEMKKKVTMSTMPAAKRESVKKENLKKAQMAKAAAERAREEKSREAKPKTNVDESRIKPTAGNPLKTGTPWSRWGGPNGDFKVDVAGLADAWPESGPPELWGRDLGDGYSAIVCDSERLYTMYRVDDEDKNLHQEVVVALDPISGETLWEHRYDAPFEKGMSMEYGPGPNSTPLVVGDRLFTVGVTVKFHCLDTKTGRVQWVHDLRKQYGASTLSRGYGASPYAYKDLIILPIGGEGQSVMAFRQKDGSVAWKNQDFSSTFATPFVARVGDEDQLIVFVGKVVAGLDPANGELKWSHAHPTLYGANISTPVLGDDGRLFIASAYNMGSRGIRLVRQDGKTVPEEMWYNRKMQIHFGNAIRIGGHIYGSSAFMGPSFFAAVDLKTGAIAWKERSIGKATCVYGDDKMIILDEDGTLYLTAISPEGIRILSKYQACEHNAWTVPTLVGKTLFVRDRKKIMALDLG